MDEHKKRIIESFKKADSLLLLKELSESVPNEEFIKFSNVALLDAYRSNRVKAVEFMLSFYKDTDPSLLLRIHMSVISENQNENDYEKAKKMLIPLINHFPEDLCLQVMDACFESRRLKSEALILKKEEINKIIKEKVLPVIHKEPKEIIDYNNYSAEELKDVILERLNKSDALPLIKLLFSKVPKEEIVNFSDKILLNAYRKNRIKAVDFILPFFDENEPKKLLKLHLGSMFDNQKSFDSGKKMIVPFIKHFPSDLLHQMMNDIVVYYQHKEEHLIKQREISKMILEHSLSKPEQIPTKKLKI